MNISALESELNQLFQWPIDSIEYRPVGGGSINQAFQFFCGSEQVFIKVNQIDPGIRMFTTEANGLKVLRYSNSFRIPEIISNGTFDSNAYLILEWIEEGSGSKNLFERFAIQLAKLHSCTSNDFGFIEDNFIGSLPQSNKAHSNWIEFYSDERIRPITRSLFDSGAFDKRSLKHSEIMLKNLHSIIPEEQPSLLHGDLWAGNFMIDTNGEPVLFDPAPYYGHREMDLAMMKLFGGFREEIFSIYHEIQPIKKNWEERILLFQLYPVLVHAELFGGSYVDQAKKIIQHYS